jgi:hypothetical protein
MELSDDRLRALAASGDETTAHMAAEIVRLRAGIRNHMQKTGHGLCWLNDLALWELIEPTVHYPHDTLPVREEFLAQCAKFYESRLHGTPYQEPTPSRTVGQK